MKTNLVAFFLLTATVLSSLGSHAEVSPTALATTLKPGAILTTGRAIEFQGNGATLGSMTSSTGATIQCSLYGSPVSSSNTLPTGTRLMVPDGTIYDALPFAMAFKTQDGIPYVLECNEIPEISVLQQLVSGQWSFGS